MKVQCLVIGGTDGHGAAMTIISEKNLKEEGFIVETYCQYPQTGKPSLFWGKTLQEMDLEPYDFIVIVDIPIPIPEPDFPHAAKDGINKISELTKKGKKILIIDHHKSTETYYDIAVKAGAEIIISSYARNCFYGKANDFSKKWGRIGAICDKDKEVLPITEEEEKLALGLDFAVRKDLKSALDELRKDNSSYFIELATPIPDPIGVSVFGKVAYAKELTQGWGFKQLDKIARENNTDYAIGADYSKGAAIIAITYWKSSAIPVVKKLGLKQFKGHESAVVIPITSEVPTSEEAKLETKTKIEEFIKILNS